MGEGWIGLALRLVDESLRAVDRKLRRTFRMLRLAQVGLVLAILGSYALAVLAILYPWYAGFYYAGAIVLLSVALIPWVVIVGLPLRLRSVKRLVAKGYPANAREMAIRVVAQKLRDESVETEELLVETAVNEGRKAYRKYRASQEAKHAEAWRPQP